MQLLQDPNQSNVDNLNNVRRDARRHFRNKKEYLNGQTTFWFFLSDLQKLGQGTK